MSFWKAGLLALLIPATLAAPAMAQDGADERPRMIFSELDANGDGSVTLEELQAAGQNRFAQADANGDGFLSRDELLARGSERIETRVDRMLERADTDGDGQISLAEAEAARENGGRRGPNPERIFNRFDANGDGAVSEAEFDEAVARLMERGLRHMGGGRHGGDRG